MGSTAFWLTRPLSGRTVLLAKAAFIGGFLILTLTAVEVAILWLERIPPLGLGLAAVDIVVGWLVTTMFLVVLAVLTQTFARFAITGAVLVVGYWLTASLLLGIVFASTRSRHDGFVLDSTLATSRDLVGWALVLAAGGLIVTSRVHGPPDRVGPRRRARRAGRHRPRRVCLAAGTSSAGAPRPRWRRRSPTRWPSHWIRTAWASPSLGPPTVTSRSGPCSAAWRSRRCLQATWPIQKASPDSLHLDRTRVHVDIHYATARVLEPAVPAGSWASVTGTPRASSGSSETWSWSVSTLLGAG